jgi:ribosomal protein L10
MYIDIVKPSGNEIEFIKQSKKLRTKGISFVYDSISKEKISELSKIENKENFHILLAKENLGFDQGLRIFDISKQLDKSRQFIEKSSNVIFFGFENSQGKDFSKQRNSGANHIIFKIMKERGNIFGICTKYLTSKERLSRLRQNLYLCNKYGVDCCIFTLAKEPLEMRAEDELFSLLITITKNPKLSNEALSFISTLL